jgi:hypothetical protein
MSRGRIFARLDLPCRVNRFKVSGIIYPGRERSTLLSNALPAFFLEEPSTLMRRGLHASANGY